MINLTTGIDAVVYGHFHNTDYREDILNADGFDSDILKNSDYYPYYYIKYSVEQ